MKILPRLSWKLTYFFTLITCSFFAGTAFSTDVFVDEFDDNSGGIPGGWMESASSDMRSGTAITETGGALVITDVRQDPEGGNSPKIVASPTFDPFPAGATTTTLEVKIDSLSNTGDANPEAVIAFGTDTIAMLINVSPNINELEIDIFESSNNFTRTPAAGSPFAFTYDGMELTLRVTFDSDSFRVVSDANPAFDSGDILYSSFSVPGFDDVGDVGPNSQISLLSETADMDGSATATFDSVNYSFDTAVVTPPPTPATVDPGIALQTSITKSISKLKKQLKKSKKNKSKSKKIRSKLKKLKKKLAAI